MTTTAPDWEGVALFTAQWVSGLQARDYFGSIMVEFWAPELVTSDCDEAWPAAESILLERLREKAAKMGANAVVGLDITLNPFAIHSDGSRRLYLRAAGTAAKLEKLF